MHKVVRLFFLMMLIMLHTTGQTHRLDSLKNVLPSLAGADKIKCLNAIAIAFNYSYIRADSALLYAGKAYGLAQQEKNYGGMALALLTKGDVEGRLLGNMAAMETYSKQAIELLTRVNEPQLLTTAWRKLAVAYISESKYDAALEAATIAKKIATDAGDKSGIGWAFEAAGLIYTHHGEYWQSFQNLIESQQIGKELHDSLMVSTSLSFIGRAFNRVGDPQMALRYYHEAMQYATAFQLLWPVAEDMAYAHLQLKQYDSVLYYQQKQERNLDSLATEVAVHKKFGTYVWGYSSEIQLAHKQYDAVIENILPALPQIRERGDIFPLMSSLWVLGKAYEAKRSVTPAINYTRELLQVAARDSNKQYLRDGNALMAALFEQRHQPDSAYRYFRRYAVIKDAMDSTQFSQRTALYLAASEATARINLLQKDNTIAGQRLALSTKELGKQHQLRNLLLICLLVLVVLFALLTRNVILKRKNEKLRHEQLRLALQRKALELEMQALRAQMNPHFIFNCLSAIDNLIQTSQPDKATSYLARFASLIRGVLESSKNNLVPFQKDFETLQLYLELEQFRCNNKFSYQLDADQRLLNGDYKVPPLVIQPFVENAIHHGLLNKPDPNRQLLVTASLRDTYIVYSVTDNGVGRERAAILRERNRPEHKSYGIAITRERIHLHNRHSVDGDVVITDLDTAGVATGTTATVMIDSLE